MVGKTTMVKTLDVRMAGLKMEKCRGCYREFTLGELDSEGWCRDCSQSPKERYIPGAPGQGSY